MAVSFGNLRTHYDAYREEIDAAVRRTLESGWYVLGRELEAFEQEFAAYIGQTLTAKADGKTTTAFIPSEILRQDRPPSTVFQGRCHVPA